MVTYEQARIATEDLDRVYRKLEPWKNYIVKIATARLQDTLKNVTDSEKNDWCVVVGIRKAMPEPHNIALRHNGVRVVKAVYGVINAEAVA